MSLERVREGFLSPITPFELYREGLLGSREDWWPPGAGRFVSELWIYIEVVERFLKGLGRRGDFLSPDTSFRSLGLGLLAGILSVLFLARRSMEGR